MSYALASLLFLHDYQADVIAARLVAEGDGRELVARWLHRTRFYRNLFGLAGLIAWVSSWSNGANGSTLLAFGLGGILTGAVVAEVHRANRSIGPRTASLSPRRVDAYLVARDQRRSVALAMIWTALAGWTIVFRADRSALVLASVGLFTLGGVRLLQNRVASRPRSALTPELERADDLVRELAITRSLAQPANAFVCAMLLPALQMLHETSMGQLADVLGVAATVTALWWWAKNKRLGLDWLLDEPGDQPLIEAAQ